ncbi:MAG: response regulator transcription factor [Elusimicrobia bacterium]|nr:response regulator transcription factor [Elusimicrobiota bacterium]
MSYRIMVVDDELDSSTLLKDILKGEGHRVSSATSAEEALHKLQSELPDILILDLGLPGMSGLRLCELLKRDPRTVALPVLMLTSRRQEAFKVEGLQVGADDYVTKPFSAKELLARIEAILRRVQRQGAPAQVLEAEGIRMDLDAHEVTLRGRKLALRPKEFELLRLFLEKQGRLLTYSFLTEAVWGDERIATRQDVKWWVHQLREKLGALGARIETVPLQGYRFAVR